ncbi:MAG: dihydrodipicolinate synthase family protein [Lentisphaeria bacterium]|nr:dihydrodipicolinate synthase family protein [Lentisphaeria bacterium]
MKKVCDIAPEVLKKVREGVAIPAQVLALDENRNFAPRYQRALTRYFIDCGVGGIAVGVHSTQFAIRDPKVGLFKPVLSETSRFIDEWCEKQGKKILKVGGVCGRTEQAVAEAEFEAANGYDAALLSLAAMKNDSIEAMLEHCKAVSEVMPIIGFYLQPSVGGRILPYEFWREFTKIENVLAIKMAPFNRYCTFDVVRAVAESGRDDITLYTGNDDNLLLDLLTEYDINGKKLRIKGGLLGHWSAWTKKAVELLDELHALISSGAPVPQELLTRAIKITDCNAAFFDPSHGFAGCIPGLHEVLRRQGLLPGIWCIDPEEVLSPGQAEEITRVHDAYPELHDDDFVAANLERWLAD